MRIKEETSGIYLELHGGSVNPVCDSPFLALSVIKLLVKQKYCLLKLKYRGFPGGAVVERPPANAGDTGSSPGPGGSRKPRSNWTRAPQLLSPCATTAEACVPGACAPQQEKPPQEKPSATRESPHTATEDATQPINK